MTSARDELLGVYLAGRYRLEEWLGADNSADFFLTSIAGGEYPAGARAVAKLAPGDAPASSQMLSIWKKTGALSHPNVLRLLDFGRADAAGRSFVYAVFEHPDETLASVLEQRALDGQEAREVHEDVAAALRYIHSHGLVHGTVDPEHIVAVGDRIKLASDDLREPGPGRQPADDLRALARMGFGPEPEPVAAEPERPPVALPPAAHTQGARVAAPPAVTIPASRRPAARHEDPAPAPRRLTVPIWAYVAIAVVLVLAVFGIRRSSQKAEEPAAGAAVPAAAAPVAASPAGESNAPERRTAKEPARTRSAWRVIAYTYSTHRDAEKKARTINTRHPALHAEVFAPRGKDRSPYLVALGGRMTREEAARLQKQAKSKGLPRDTFIRNYSE